MPVNSYVLLPGQPERCRAGAALELQRQNAHVDEIAAVDPLEALGDDRGHAEQQRALGRPVARRSRSVLLAGNDQQRHALALVLHRGVVDRHHRAVGLMRRPAAFGARRHLIAQPHVGERAAHHHFVVAAARAVRVEVARLHAVRDQVLPRRGCPS